MLTKYFLRHLFCAKIRILGTVRLPLLPPFTITDAIGCEFRTHILYRMLLAQIVIARPDLEHKIESLTAALETAQAQTVTEDEIEHRVQIAVQNSTAEMHSRLAQFESYVSAVVKQGQALVNGTVAGESGESAPIVFAPMNRVKRMEQQVEDNPRITRTSKKIFRTLVEEYPDFPNGMSKAKLAMLCKLKVTSGGGFNQPLADLRARRYITINGSGETALVAINAEMLR